jgi:hypothetical protein
MLTQLQLSSNDFALASRYYGEAKDLRKLAQSQNDLGAMFCLLPTADRADNYRRAIEAFQSAGLASKKRTVKPSHLVSCF